MVAALNRSELVPKLCERLAQGDSLSTICAEKGFPSRTTISEWMDADPDIRTAIARARDIGFDERAERAVLEAKSCEDATKARLAFDAERWYLSKLNPARYGERIQTAQTDVNGNDASTASDDLPAEIAALVVEGLKLADGFDLA